MKYAATLKGLKLFKKEEHIISHQLGILELKLHNFDIDVPELILVLKNHEKNHFISGSITLTLPKKKLIAKMEGHEVSDVLHEGFDKLNKEFETYKAKHFKGSSKHPSRDTVGKKKLDI